MKNRTDKDCVEFEDEMVDALTVFLSNNGYRVRTEVPNMGQSAALVATKGRWVLVIEAKMGDWKRALNQCLAHEIVADYIALAVASRSISSALVTEIEKLGYGLIHCDRKDGSCAWIAKPKFNRQIWKPQRSVFSQRIRKVNCVN